MGEKIEGEKVNENYKIQATNYKQTTIPKLQITKKDAPCGLV